MSSSDSSNTVHGKRHRPRFTSNQSVPPLAEDAYAPVFLVFTFSTLTCFSFRLEQEKQQYLEQLAEVNTLISYFQEKMTEHGLQPTAELLSPCPDPALTLADQQSILSSFMHEHESSDVLLHQQQATTTDSSEPVAMKLPRHFLPLDLKNSATLEIIHSPYRDGNEIEYKKELSSDILNKYGGQTKKSKASPSTPSHRSQRKQRKVGRRERRTVERTSSSSSSFSLAFRDFSSTSNDRLVQQCP